MVENLLQIGVDQVIEYYFLFLLAFIIVAFWIGVIGYVLDGGMNIVNEGNELKKNDNLTYWDHRLSSRFIYKILNNIFYRKLTFYWMRLFNIINYYPDWIGYSIFRIIIFTPLLPLIILILLTIFGYGCWLQGDILIRFDCLLNQ
tara:strand:- start:116 stop:550 length:435 start_codon:yes stop_codon:yes gene_type:complete